MENKTVSHSKPLQMVVLAKEEIALGKDQSQDYASTMWYQIKTK